MWGVCNTPLSCLKRIENQEIPVQKMREIMKLNVFQTNKQGSKQAQHNLEINANLNCFSFDYPIVNLLKIEHIVQL